VTRELVTQQADAGAALTRSDALRRAALAQQQQLEEQGDLLAARTTALTAELERVGAELVRARAAESLAELEQAALAARAQQAAAERAAQVAADAAGVPYVPGPLLPGPDGSCNPPTGRGEANGFLSSASLCPLATRPGHRLRTDAARAFDALNAARLAASGTRLCITDSYRDYPSQVDVFRRKPGLAATPVAASTAGASRSTCAAACRPSARAAPVDAAQRPGLRLAAPHLGRRERQPPRSLALGVLRGVARGRPRRSGLTRGRRRTTVNRVVHHQFAALGDPTRLAIVERLARGPTSAGELAAPTTLSLPAVLKHVRVLEEAGLVTTVKRGRVRECRLRDDALVAVATWTAQQQALWSTRLDALGTLLEDT
jgi:DNA-binding transcriptional ArsR family regulator